jgi:hypothetical protein
LPAGSYFLALTEEDNLPFGPTFADGFSRSGEGNFTPGLTGIPGDSFLDLSPSQRNGNWAVVLERVDAPEPGALGLVLIGIVKILWPRINGNKRELAARTFLLLVFSLTFVASGYGTTGVLSDDATVQVGYASSNFGALPNLQVGPNSRALLKFQLGADLPVVTRARVKLWVNKVGNPGSVWLEPAAGTWDERSVTFANAPLLDVSNISVIDVGSANSYVVADVTVFVARALTRGAGDVSFGLVGTSSTDVIFDSKENTATGHAPELELDLAGSAGPVGPVGAAGPVGPAGSNGAPGPALQLSGYQVIDYNLTGGFGAARTLACPAAYPKLVAGGCGFPFAANGALVALTYSGPEPSSSTGSWQCNGINNTVVTEILRIYVQCSQ